MAVKSTPPPSFPVKSKARPTVSSVETLSLVWSMSTPVTPVGKLIWLVLSSVGHLSTCKAPSSHPATTRLNRGLAWIAFTDDPNFRVKVASTPEVFRMSILRIDPMLSPAIKQLDSSTPTTQRMAHLTFGFRVNDALLRGTRTSHMRTAPSPHAADTQCCPIQLTPYTSQRNEGSVR